MTRHRLLALLALWWGLATVRTSVEGCQVVSRPADAVALLASATGKTICVQLVRNRLDFGSWSFEGYDLVVAPNANVTLDCSNLRMSGLYTSPLTVGDNSSVRLQHCDVYSYEHSILYEGSTELTAFFRPSSPDNGASFEFVDSFRYWPCNEIKRVYVRAFNQHKEDPGPAPFVMGPVVTQNESTAYTFIDTDPFRITRSMPLMYRNVTYYCGLQSTRWKNAVDASRAAETSGHVPFRILPGDFPLDEDPVEPRGSVNRTAVVLGSVFSALVVLVLLLAGFLFVRHRRAARNASDAVALPKSPMPPPHSRPAENLHDTYVCTDSRRVSEHSASKVDALSGSGTPSMSPFLPRALPMFASVANDSDGVQMSRTDARARFVAYMESDADLNLMPSEASAAQDEGFASTSGHHSHNAGSHSAGDFVRSCETDVPSVNGHVLLNRLADVVAALQHDIGDGALKKHCLIGAGAFSLVYRGTWRGLEVAIKAIVFEGTMDNEDTRRIVSEAAIAMSMAHENIVGTYTHDIAPLEQGNGAINLYKLRLVQEYCNGGNLAALLGNVDFRQALLVQDQPLLVELEILRSIARAMRYLHMRRVIHADLKPGNVMLKYDGSAFTSPAQALLAGQASLKVMDFGLAQRLREKDPHLSFSNAGTRWYAAPEVLSEGFLYLASDVYSFGVIAWEVVTHSSIVQRVQSHTRNSIDSTTGFYRGDYDRSGWVRNTEFPRLNDTVPEAVRRVVTDCLRTEQAERPAFKEVMDALDGLIAAIRGPS